MATAAKESGGEVRAEKTLNAIWDKKYSAKSASKAPVKGASRKKHALPAALKAHEFKKGARPAKKGRRSTGRR